MTITDKIIKDSNIKYVLKDIKKYGSVMTEFEFVSTVSSDNFLDWLGLNIERYAGDVTQYYKTNGTTVTVEFK